MTEKDIKLLNDVSLIFRNKTNLKKSIKMGRRDVLRNASPKIMDNMKYINKLWKQVWAKRDPEDVQIFQDVVILGIMGATDFFNLLRKG